MHSTSFVVTKKKMAGCGSVIVFKPNYPELHLVMNINGHLRE